MPVMSSAPACRPPARAFIPVRMTGGSGKSGDLRRAERLKAALRDNLKRRKAQMKARSQAVGQGGRARFRRNHPRNCPAQAERLVTLRAVKPCGRAVVVLRY